MNSQMMKDSNILYLNTNTEENQIILNIENNHSEGSSEWY